MEVCWFLFLLSNLKRGAITGTSVDVHQLDADEVELDRLLEARQADLKNFLQEKAPWVYVNFDDIKRLEMMKDQTIFAIRAQPGTKLEVPDPDMVSNKSVAG